MPLLTELEDLNGKLSSINISLLTELVDIFCSVSFGEIGTMLETQAGCRTLPTWHMIWVLPFTFRTSCGGIDPRALLNADVCCSQEFQQPTIPIQ
jgi:hypothetical protein